MQIQMIKQIGGVLIPANENEARRMERFKSNEQYPIEMKLSRGLKFHNKVFAFFNHCFNYWSTTNEFQCDDKQFDVFRKKLTILAGFHKEFYSIDGSVSLEADSLSYTNMTQEEFERLYGALINAAMIHIFNDCDEITFETLRGFF